MPSKLRNTVTFPSVAPGTMAVLPHELNLNGAPLVPDLVEVDDGNFSVVLATDTDVTIQNDGVSTASVNVYVEEWHTFDRVFGQQPGAYGVLNPRPYLPKSGPGVTEAQIFSAAAQDQRYIEPLTVGNTATAHKVRLQSPFVAGRLTQLT